MFARFRQSRTGRLHVSIVEARRVNGAVRQEHIASLGSIVCKPAIRDRIPFWQQIEERLHALSNRLDVDTIAKVRAAIHERIPRPTKDEIAAARAADASDEIAGWNDVKDGGRSIRSSRRAGSCAAVPLPAIM